MAQNFDERLQQVNQRLTKVALFVRDNHLWIRGTFPPKKKVADTKPEPYQQKFSTGQPATPVGLQEAEKLAKGYSEQLIRGNFVWEEDKGTDHQTPLSQLWADYTTYKRPQLSQSTLAVDYVRVANWLERHPDCVPADAVSLRDAAMTEMSPDAARRMMMRLSGCCQWCVESGKLESNPFQGFAKKIKKPKGQASKPDINVFSKTEMDWILHYFRENKHGRYYANFVEFLYLTGCRPSEAIALTWGDLPPDLSSINFNKAAVVGEDGLSVKSGLKTQANRTFPCNAQLRSLLLTQKPETIKLTNLVFPSPKGLPIDFHNFANRHWGPALKTLGIPYRKPYQIRHTMITMLLEKGIDAKDIAALVGNSATTIYKHYAGQKKNIIVPDL